MSVMQFCTACLCLWASIVPAFAEIVDSGSMAASQSLRAQALQKPSENLTSRAQRNFWAARDAEAYASGDVSLRKKVIDDALRDMADDARGTAMFRKRLLDWMIVTKAGYDKILPAGEALLKDVGTENGFVYKLAGLYLDTLNFKRADELLRVAQSNCIDHTRFACSPLGAENLKTQYELKKALIKGDLQTALDNAQRRVELSEKIVAQSDRNAPLYLDLQSRRVHSRLAVIDILCQLNRRQEARQLLKQTIAIAQEIGSGGVVSGKILYAEAMIEDGDHNYEKALTLLKQAEAVLHKNGISDAGNIENAYVQILIEHNQIAQAATFEHKHASSRDHVIVRLLQNQLDPALQSAQKYFQYNLGRKGTDHPMTRRSQLMVKALQLVKNPASGNLAELLNDCAEQTQHNLPDQHIDRIFNRVLATTCLRAFAHATERNPTGLDAAFQLTAVAQDSGVGETLAAAARRSIRNQPDLAGILDSRESLKLKIKADFKNLAKIQRESIKTQAETFKNLQEGLQKDQQELIALERNLTKRFPEFSRISVGNVVHLSDVTRQLGRDEVVLVLLPTQTELYAWVLTRDRTPQFFVSAISANEVSVLVAAMRKTLDQGESAQRGLNPFDYASAYKLYQLVLQPAAQGINGYHELIVVPGGALARIPFGVVLSHPYISGTAPAWLIRDYAISHVSSVDALVALRLSDAHTAAPKAFIGFGDPDFKGNDELRNEVADTRKTSLQQNGNVTELDAALRHYGEIPALPETRDEILALAHAMGADPSRDIYLGKRASRKNVLKVPLQNYRVISFATHGLVAGDLPGLNQPALALAAPHDPAEQPLLLLEDVMRLRLNADWVVLSACNTAAADGESAEALSGLARGFFYAGARSLLVTHWAVESTSAEKLMIETFKAYATDKALSRADALRTAQLKLLNNPRYTHPFFWAPYALVGDGS